MLLISAEDFRRRLAGLSVQETSENENKEMRELGIDLALALRDVFGDSLDRKTIWTRISNAISISAYKCGGNAEKFIADALDYVKADASRVIDNQKLRRLSKEIKGQSHDWQMAFIRECRDYKNLILLEVKEIVMDKKMYREFNDMRNEGGESNE